MQTCKRVLCPVDFSDCSDLALAEAASLAKTAGAELTVLHAYQDPAYVMPMQGFVGLTSDFVGKMRAQLEEELRALAGPLRDEGVAVQTALLEGAPYKCIVEHAKDWHADLIVMGTHGRTGVAHALAGSVTERVVRHAPCSVLVTRGTA